MSACNYSRRDFLKFTSVGMGVLGLFGCQTTGSQSGEKSEITLRVPGAVKSFTFVHWADSHLCECDWRNDDLTEYMAARQVDVFGGAPTKVAKEMVSNFNRLRPDIIALTGDFVDVPTEANMNMGEGILDSLNSLVCFAMGNHEWNGMAKPQEQDYWQERFKVMLSQPMDWHVQRMHGVNLLFIDDSNYQITPSQVERTQQLLESDRPCILFVHIPISTNSLIADTVKIWKTPILLGNEDILAGRKLKIEPSTAKFCSLVKSHPQMKAIFAGHLHFNHEDEYRQGCYQYVTGGGFNKQYRLIRVVPG